MLGKNALHDKMYVAELLICPCIYTNIPILRYKLLIAINAIISYNYDVFPRNYN